MFIAECRVKTDVVFVISTSNQVRGDRHQAILDLIAAIIDRFEVGPGQTRVGLMSYSDSAQIHFNLTDHQTSVQVTEALYRVPYSGGSTRVASAIQIMVMLNYSNTLFSTGKFHIILTSY